MHGKGIRRYINGDIYMGDWKNGKKYGMGSVWYPSGDHLEGRFRNDVFLEHTDAMKQEANRDRKLQVSVDGGKHGSWRGKKSSTNKTKTDQGASHSQRGSSGHERKSRRSLVPSLPVSGKFTARSIFRSWSQHSSFDKAEREFRAEIQMLRQHCDEQGSV
jgi:hypothetical protein